MHRFWLILLLAAIVVLVTAPRLPSALATNGDKVIKRRDTNPCNVREVMSWHEDVSQTVMGSNRGAGKDFFSHEISVEVCLNNHLLWNLYDVLYKCELY